VHDLGRLHPHHAEPQAASAGRTRSVALWVLCLCALTTGLDMTITNVALPFIGRALDTSLGELQWVVDSYNIVLAGLLVFGGALADRYGRRRIFLASYTLFAIASAAAAFSATSGELIAARSVMAVGAAGVTAPALAIIATLYAPEERAGAIGVFVVFGAIGLTVGPIAGGLLLDNFWWGSVFLVNVPIVAAGVVAGMRTLPESRAPRPEGSPPGLDVVGALLSVVGLALALFGIIEGPSRGWTDPAVLVAIVVGASLIVLFARRELRAHDPLFDVRILRWPAVLAGSVTLFTAYFVFNSFLFLYPQYLQDVLSESIISVGLLLVPFSVVFGIASTRAPQVLARFGARATITVGLATTAVAALAFAVAVNRSIPASIAASCVLALGLSLLIAPPSTVVMNALPATKAGDGSSLNFVSRFVGASVGIAVVGSVLGSIYQSNLSGSLGGLTAGQAADARGSLQGALEVAATLPAQAGRELADAARDAFDRGATWAYVTVALLAALAALWAWLALGRRGDEMPTS
jgi:DHA2 family multidrug resistance protein-like MFS transporter